MHVGLIIAKLVTMTIGFLIAYQAYRGYRRYHSPPMLYVAIGFAAISIGAAIEGILFDVGGFTFHDAGTVGTAFVALGMLSSCTRCTDVTPERYVGKIPRVTLRGGGGRHRLSNS